MQQDYDHKANQATSIPDSLFIVDAHCDVLMALLNEERQFTQHSSCGHVDLPRLKIGGVGLQFMAAYIEAEYKPERSLKRVLQIIDLFYREVAANSQEITLATSVEDIKQAFTQNKLSVILAIEGGEALAGDLAILRMLYRLGVRSIGLTWNQRNALGDGVGESHTGGGLTNFGRAVVGEMNRLGMLIDVSHLAEQGFWDVMKTSEKPVIASHSNCVAICQHRRNLSDAQIKELARHGGVIGVTFAPAFVNPGKASINDVIQHIAHIANLVGIQHVGIGTDFDGIEAVPTGLEDISKLPQLTKRLIEHGFSEQDIRKIMGENILRLLGDVLAG